MNGDVVPMARKNPHAVVRAKLTSEAQAKILVGVRKGLSFSGAVAPARINSRIVQEVLAAASEDPDDPLHEFAFDVGEQCAEWERETLEAGRALADAGKNSWTFYMTHLERRLPHAYGRQQKVTMEHTGAGDLEKRLRQLGGDRTTGD